PREGPLSLLDRDPGGQGESLAVARSEAARIRLRGAPCAAGMTTERSRHDRPAVVACVRDGGPMSGERRRRLGGLLAAGLVALVTALTAWGSASTPAAADAQRGGTLPLLGTGDIFNLDTTSGYNTVLNIIARGFTRQLVSFRSSPDFRKEIA